MLVPKKAKSSFSLPCLFLRIVRYEDLVSDLDGQIPQFLSSLGLPMQASVKRFIYKTTSPSEIRGNRQGPFGRNPIETMNRWKASISYPVPLQKKYSRVLIRRTDPNKRTGQNISLKKISVQYGEAFSC